MAYLVGYPYATSLLNSYAGVSAGCGVSGFAYSPTVSLGFPAAAYGAALAGTSCGATFAGTSCGAPSVATFTAPAAPAVQTFSAGPTNCGVPDSVSVPHVTHQIHRQPVELISQTKQVSYNQVPITQSLETYSYPKQVSVTAPTCSANPC